METIALGVEYLPAFERRHVRILDGDAHGIVVCSIGKLKGIDSLFQIIRLFLKCWCMERVFVALGNSNGCAQFVFSIVVGSLACKFLCFADSCSELCLSCQSVGKLKCVLVCLCAIIVIEGYLESC